MSGSICRLPAALRLLGAWRSPGLLVRPLSQGGAPGSGAREAVERLVRAHPVVVFMKGSPAQPQCGFSNAVVQILRLHGVSDYRAYDVLQDPDLRQGQRAPGSFAARLPPPLQRLRLKALPPPLGTFLLRSPL